MTEGFFDFTLSRYERLWRFPTMSYAMRKGAPKMCLGLFLVNLAGSYALMMVELGFTNRVGIVPPIIMALCVLFGMIGGWAPVNRRPVLHFGCIGIGIFSGAVI